MRAVRAGGVLAKVVAVLEMVRRRFARRCCCVSFTARWFPAWCCYGKDGTGAAMAAA